MVASICGFVVVFMVGASYAAVPFYDWFCRATGFNGTTQVATSAPSDAPLARKISVRFDANVGPGLPWKFEPEQNEIEVRIGEVVTVFYTVTNQAAQIASRRGLTRDAVVASICGFVVVLMVGASYAAVPFYNWFCRATGFNGTTQVATSAPSDAPLERKITVRFDANVAPGLPWKFQPEQNEIEVRIGEVVTVFYTVTNQAARTTAALAAYNVAPLTVGAYFQKINCFCFTEQTMGPGEKREMPVVFYVDPQLAKDSENDGLNTITLSYTFYPVRDSAPKPVAAGEGDKRKGNL